MKIFAMDRYARNTALLIALAGLGLVNQAQAEAQVKFSLTATTATTIQAFPGQTVTVRYIVTNNTKVTRRLTMLPISGGTQTFNEAGSCGQPFLLASQQSCFLNLSIKVPQTGIVGGPQVCKTLSDSNNNPDPFLCSQPSRLNSLSISASATNLPLRVAVGNTGGTVVKPLVYTSQNNGETWGAPIILKAQGLSTLSFLSSVSCNSSGLECASVGTYSNNASLGQPLAYHSLDGGLTWTSPITPALPSHTPAYIRGRLQGVSCSGSGLICSAVGSANTTTTTNPIFPISYYSTNAGQSWSLSNPQPASLSGNGRLLAVSCHGTRCTAVGDERIPTSARTRGLGFYSLNGGKTWTLSTGLLSADFPVGNLTTVTYAGVDCDASGRHCVAVGSYNDTTIGRPALTSVSEDGGKTWQPSAAYPPFPGPLTLQTQLRGISCNASGKRCTAIGFLADSNTNETYNISYTSKDGGEHWSTQQIIPTAGAVNTLNGVFCAGTEAFCLTVGSNTTNIYDYNSQDYGNTWQGPVIIPAPIAGSNISSVSGRK